MGIKRDDIQAAMDGFERDFPPPHPGNILRDEFLEPLGITQTRLASDLGIPIGRINQIITGKRAITAETAILLARFFGTNPQYWMDLQTGYDIARALPHMGQALQKVHILHAEKRSA